MPLLGQHTVPALATQDEEWSTGAKVAAGVAVVGFGLLAYAALRSATAGIFPPSAAELTFLLDPVNKLSIAHIKVMRALANACGNNVDKMMAMIEPYAMKLSEIQVSSLFPPISSVLPMSTEYSMTATYPNAFGELTNSTIAMFSSAGSKLWDVARADTIRNYCAENVFPVLRQMFTYFVTLASKGLNDVAIFEIMSAPAYGVALDLSDPFAISNPGIARLAMSAM